MATYEIYFRDTKVATITSQEGRKQRYDLDIFGLHYFDLPEEDLLLSCSLLDVRVTKDGQEVTLEVVREILPSFCSMPAQNTVWKEG